jgi:hypothetical protein
VFPNTRNHTTNTGILRYEATRKSDTDNENWIDPESSIPVVPVYENYHTIIRNGTDDSILTQRISQN